MKTYFYLTLCFCALIFMSSCDELSSKSEYAILQQVEFEYRQNKLTEILIISKNDYLLAGFPSKVGDVNVWVLLNTRFYPYYKQIPQSDFVIRAEDLEKIKIADNVSSKVIEELELRLNAK